MGNYRGCIFEEPIVQIIRAGIGLQGLGRGEEPIEISAEPDGAEEQEIPFRFDGRPGVARMLINAAT